jgi:2'-5' RNA ligase
MPTARLFIAIDTDEGTRRELGACTRTLGTVLEGVRWVAPEAMHVTLCFLGATPTERLADLGEAMGTGLAGKRAAVTGFRGLGVFPDTRRPTVLWAGVDTGGEALAAIAGGLRETLAAGGFPVDQRPFAAHLTLGRFGRAARVREEFLQGLLERWSQTHFGTCVADQVTLYASVLTPAGPLYDPLRRWALGAPPP